MTDFRKTFVEHKISGQIFTKTLSEIILLLRSIQQNIINVRKSPSKVPIILLKV